MNRTFTGCSGQGHSRSPSDTSPEGPSSNRTTARSQGDTTGLPEVPATHWTTARPCDDADGSTMTSPAGCRNGTNGSAVTSASSSNGISTTLLAWAATGCPDPDPATSSPGAFGSDVKDEPRDTPPGKAGSSVSLASYTTTGGGEATRVTSNTTIAISIRIVANTDATATASSTAEPGGTIPRTEGLATATRYRMGFKVSYMVVRAILSPGIPRPLTEGMGQSHSNKKLNQQKTKRKRRKTYRVASGTTLKADPDIDGPAHRGPLPDRDPHSFTLVGGKDVPTGSYPAYGSSRPPAWESSIEAIGAVSSDYDSCGTRAPIRSSDRPTCSTMPAAGRYYPHCESCIGTGPSDVRVSVRSSADRPPCSATSTTGRDRAGDAVKGHSDRVHFDARSPTTSALAACFLDEGFST
ncbi:uncharacterized protein [Miscanthus floridulus]|uniref:uncharacterized protein n=1 Tax=Miscanthus floridulus TaxID=154761 RepID=UPI0034579858